MSRPSREQSLREAIAREEARLASLEAERERARRRVDALKGELETVKADTRLDCPGTGTDPAAPESSTVRVALFRSLFRGRNDVYSQLWTNARTGRHGYAPACANEWVRGICEKPRVKCGACPNQAFLPVTEQVVLDHLQGRRVVGVYPLFSSTTRAGSSRLTSTRAAGPTTWEHSPRPAEIEACRWRSNARGLGKAPTRGSSFRDKSPRARQGRWPAISSPRRCRGATSSAWAHTIASSPAPPGARRGPGSPSRRPRGPWASREASLTDDQTVLERPACGLALGVHREADGAELHLDDWMRAVASVRRRGQAGDETCLDLGQHSLPLKCRSSRSPRHR